MNAPYSRQEDKDISVEEKLRALHELQSVVSEVDKIKTLRGELPLEVQDLEDEIAGLKTRLINLDDEIKNLDTSINNKKIAIKDSQALIAKYTEQQNNVRNNREFDSLSKEIEFQNLEIELSEKRIKEFTAEMAQKKETISNSKEQLKEREEDLDRKKNELSEITEETKIEEEKLKGKSEKIESFIEPRLLGAFKRIRKNARNGLAVVTIQRDACGGCFNKIPPQRQLDIASRKKIIVCEYCGRILVDQNINVVEDIAD
ncbi:C4-type zinc ribbon domain-containing protein [Draconibacterium sp. IB214405]|uniref:zinc ribbon domain-containing protein n=1 Tax=Draconibacterium sp. IB214405 TaxID=3097352 RepID=UPI002A171D9A|nr:C4-type zinc ribbon domain-containing protein [Draconibacterium sp. IB214405]MDX8338499.1 C4-type zinc ribbon domain-containing protein [Draconibacterium sp. IB214405]